MVHSKDVMLKSNVSYAKYYSIVGAFHVCLEYFAYYFGFSMKILW